MALPTLYMSDVVIVNFRFLWPCIVSKVWRERKNQQDATIRYLLLTSVSTCFGDHYAHLQENKDRVTAFGELCWFCWMWLVAVVGRCVVGCEHCSHPKTQRPTTATNHNQQNQRSTLYAVTQGLFSPEDGHNDARNMLRQKFIINIWLLHLVGFFSLSSHLTLSIFFPIHYLLIFLPFNTIV